MGAPLRLWRAPPPASVRGLLLVLTLAAAATSALAKSAAREDDSSCAHLRHLFRTRNLTADTADSAPGLTCGGHCCSADVEKTLRTVGSRDLEGLLRHHAISLHGLFATTASAIQSHVLDLARQSENKTLYLFHQVYSKMSVLSKEPIGALYSDIRNFVSNISDVGGSADFNIEPSVSKFFMDLFPLVYHHAMTGMHNSDFTKEYKVCLVQSVQEIQPFGDIPRQISNSMFKSLEATKVLLKALALGSEVLNTTDSLVKKNSEKVETATNACHTALLKMSYCSKCMGLQSHVKPCSGYCTNVLRGCLTQHVSELDLPWNRFVEAIERLVIAVKGHDKNVDADTVLRSLDTKISEAIMYAMENGPYLEKKVKKTCGHAQFYGEDSGSNTGDKSSDANSGKPHRVQPFPPSFRISPLDTQLLHFLASVTKSKGFFLNLADTICKDDSFAEQGEGKECWNGDRVGEYTKPVIDSTLTSQKYNPEIEFASKNTHLSGSESDKRILKLSDRLKDMRQLVVQQIGAYPSPVSESFMQRDMAEGDRWGESGSGSRIVNYDDNDDSDTDWNAGSGSGDDEYENPTSTTGVDNTVNKIHVTGSGTEHSGGAISEYYYCTLFAIMFSLFTSARDYMRLL